MPQTAILYIAQNCNQQCVFCLEEDGSWNEFVDPSTREVDAEIARLYERGARQITFMGGETFFRKDLPRIISGAKSRGYTRIGVTTNGTVLSKRGFIARLVGAGLDFIEMSVHGHTLELANAISRSEVTFKRQARALAEIESAGTLKTIVNVVICHENKDHLIDVARYVREGFPNIPLRFKFKFVSLQGWEADRAEQDRPLGYDEVDFISVGDYVESQGVPFWFYNVPLCRLGRHARRAHELATLAGDETYFDMDHRGSAGYYDSGPQFDGRVWPREPCGACTLKPLCPGLEETHRLARGGAFLSARSDDPLPLVEFALESRGLPPSGARERLEVLKRQPRPERFVRKRPDGALRFRHEDAPEPLDLTLEERKPEQRAFFMTEHFALSYRRWVDGDPSERPDVQALLEAACAALDRADESGRTIADAWRAISKVEAPGWRFDESSEVGARATKTVAPVLVRDIRPPARRAEPNLR